jgi:hypothetical protein
VASETQKNTQNWIDFQGCVGTGAYIRIYIYNFSVALVFEQNPFDALGDDLIVGRVVRTDYLVFPVVEAQVSRFGQQLPFVGKVLVKLFGLETMRIVNVAGYLLAFGVFIANKYY